MSSRRSAGFTLIEVLIVVVIMAILAAVVIPRFSTSNNDAKEALIRDHLRTIRTQIEVYKVQHKGAVPNGVNSLAQLFSATDVAGNVSPTGQVDSTHPYGPYLRGGLPIQPFSGFNMLRDAPVTLFTPLPALGAGWMYQASTGRFWVDHADYFSW